MTRNKFISLLLVMLLLVTLGSGCATTSTEPDEDVAEDLEEVDDVEEVEEVTDKSTDIVVIGAGGAGMSAALEIHRAGKDVIIVETMPMMGGNTLRATGGINAAGTSVQEGLGIEDDPEIHFADTMKGGYDKNDPDLVRTMTDNAVDAVEWLISIGADLSDVGKLAGSTNNRSHRPTGGAAVGAHIATVLRENVEKENIEVLLETTATEILYEDGRVQGVVVEDFDGNVFKINAKVVIVATGGFGANAEMVSEIDPSLEGFGTTNHPGAMGDGLKMAQAIGADVTQIEEIQTHPTAVPSNGFMITEAVRGNGAILINKEGKRFSNELATRDVVSADILDQDGQTSFLFFDESVRGSLAAIEEYVEMGLTTEGATIEEVAEQLDMDPATLVATIEEYNGFVDAGEDKAFARDDLPRKLVESGYYAIEVGPAVHHCMGGLKINTKAQVIDTDGNIIPGLYAAGEVTGGVHGGNRLGGNALADITVFGRIAAKTALEEL